MLPRRLTLSFAGSASPSWRIIGSFVSATLGMGACGDSTEKSIVGTDTSDVTFSEVTFDVEVNSQEVTVPSDFGDACASTSECETGNCVEGPSGFVCSMGCTEGFCPNGWNCLGIQTAGDIAFVCVPGGVAPDTSDTTQPDTTQPDTTQPDTTQPDTTQPDTTQPDTTQPDTTQPPGTTACDAPPGVGSDNLLAESQVPQGDWPDCITGDCFEVNPNVWVVDLRSTSWTGAMGGLDNEVHTYDFNAGVGPGPDIDIVAIKAPPRTMVELAVLKSTTAGRADPVIYTHDGFGVRTYNSDVSDTNSCARTTIGFPYISDLPIYAVIEDAANYDRWSPTGYSPGTVGGSDYGWILRIRTTPWQPTELGPIALNQVLTVTGDALTVGGQTRYFRFVAPGTARPRITVTRTGGAGFEPTVAGLKTIEGELVWQRVEYDGDGNGAVTLQNTGMRPCIPASECPSGFSCPPNLCTSAEVEWVFAVLDYNGVAAPGGSRFDVRVEVLP